MYRTVYFIGRDFKRWVRAPANMFSTLFMPIAWLMFVGLVLPVRSDYDNYLDFVTPGILVLTMMNAGLSSGSSVMFDKTLGYLNKFLALPVPRESILFGKILFFTIRGLIQALIILMVAILIGATVHGPEYYVVMVLILFLFGLTISALGATVSLYMPDFDTYSAFSSMITMPLYFASTSLVAYDDMPSILQAISTCNPLTYAIDALRDIAAGVIPLMQSAVLLLIFAVVISLCIRKFRIVTMK